jgi:hypothetical protein
LRFHYYQCDFSRSRDYNKVTDNRNTGTNSSRVDDRTQLHRILAEVGLNPSNYTFSPLPNESSPQELSGGRTSAFSDYASQQQQPANQQLLKPQSKALFTSGRPVSYVQQPPPPPPQTSNRDQGPPSSQGPPPPPSSSSSGPPPALASLLFGQPSSSNRDQAPTNQQQGPPPLPTSSKQGSSQPPYLSNRSGAETQNPPSKSQQDMSHQAFSPRRLPPSPPHFNSHPNDSQLSADHYLRQINSVDNPPVKVVKPNTQNVVYRKEIRIRYLQPPTPPPPAPIIIREKHIPPRPPQSVRIDFFPLASFYQFFSSYLYSHFLSVNENQKHVHHHH